jgi:hypothetical protein
MCKHAELPPQPDDWSDAVEAAILAVEQGVKLEKNSARPLSRRSLKTRSRHDKWTRAHGPRPDGTLVQVERR